MDVHLFRTVWEREFIHLKKCIEVIDQANSEIQHSILRIKKLLEAALSIFNFVSGGAQRGCRTVKGLESLNLLSEMKCPQQFSSKGSLIHYLADVVEELELEDASSCIVPLYSEWMSVWDAPVISVKAVSERFEKLQQSLNLCQIIIGSGGASYNDEEQVLSFLRNGFVGLDLLSSQIASVSASTIGLRNIIDTTYQDEAETNSKSCPIQTFYSRFVDLMLQYKAATQQNHEWEAQVALLELQSRYDDDKLFSDLVSEEGKPPTIERVNSVTPDIDEVRPRNLSPKREYDGDGAFFALPDDAISDSRKKSTKRSKFCRKEEEEGMHHIECEEHVLGLLGLSSYCFQQKGDIDG